MKNSEDKYYYCQKTKQYVKREKDGRFYRLDDRGKLMISNMYYGIELGEIEVEEISKKEFTEYANSF